MVERPYSFCPSRTPALHLLYQRSVRQKFSTPGISELSVQNIRDSGEMLSKDRCKTTAGFFVIPLLSQLWGEKNYCERRYELSSWRPVALPNRHIHLYLFKLGYDVHALLSSVMYGENSTAVFTISRRRWDQNTTQVANRLNRGGILGGNPDRSLKSFPPCYSQTPLYTNRLYHLLRGYSWTKSRQKS